MVTNRKSTVVKKRHVEDLKKIMSVDEEMLRILPALSDQLNFLNAWVRQLPGVFRDLNLKKGQVILDLPCGKAGVSVSLAKTYNVKVLGYDILKEYIESAKKLAKKQKVDYLCTFKVDDIRNVTKRKNICDILLWIAPPHIWKNSKKTIKSLKNCVKKNGIILIADAYVYKLTDKYPDYQTLEETNQGYTKFGDEIIRFIDYKNKLWKEDYDRTRKTALKVFKKTDNKKDKQIIRKYIKSLNKEEKSDTKYLGLGIWIIKINKN